MQILWDRVDISVSEVLKNLRPEGGLHHNTVMTVMNRLVRKGWLSRRAGKGRAFNYRPKVSREHASQAYLQMVTTQFFDGSIAGMVGAFLGGATIPPAEFARLRSLLKDAEGDRP